MYVDLRSMYVNPPTPLVGAGRAMERKNIVYSYARGDFFVRARLCFAFPSMGHGGGAFWRYSLGWFLAMPELCPPN